MDIEALPGELSRTAYQHLRESREFDDFVLDLLWRRLSDETKTVVGQAKAWYFGESHFEGDLYVPTLVLYFSGTALLAQKTHGFHLFELAEHCRALCRCDRLHITGQDQALRYWFNYHSGEWVRLALSQRQDWQEGA